MLTVAQNNEIERMQRQVFKLAFGKEKSYLTLCEENGYSTLKERRCAYIDKFVCKAIQNERFSDSWFPKREANGDHGLRNARIYHETRSRTNRHYNSPLSFMRRRANDLALDEERNYA